MKRFLLLALAMNLVVFSAAYGWTRLYGREGHVEAYSVRQTTDGGFIMTASSPWDLLKLNLDGDSLWSRHYYIGPVRCAEQTSDGGFILTGHSVLNLALLKTDSMGVEIWRREYGGEEYDEGYFVQQTADGGYVITGSTGASGVRDNDLWLLKTDSSGDTIWTRVYGSEDENDVGRCVRQTTDGGYIILGEIGLYGAWLLKTDSEGDTMWTHILEGLEGNCVVQVSDGGYVVCRGGGNLWLSKIDSAGVTLWTKTYGMYTNGRCVQETTDGGYVITGRMNSELYLLKTDSEGDTVWTRSFGDGGWKSDFGQCVRQTKGGGYIVVGGTKSFSEDGTNDIWLIRTDEYGDTLWFDVSPGTVEMPKADSLIDVMIPGAWFKNKGTMSAQDFYCHCEISSAFCTPDYHVKYWVSYPVNPEDSVEIEFAKWVCDDHSRYTARFYTSKEAESLWSTNPMSVEFQGTPYVGVLEDDSVTTFPYWKVTSCGSEIVLRYSSYPYGFSVNIFDATGRKVDEVRSADASGIITWPATPVPSGVYFIKVESENQIQIHKVILLK